MGDWVTAGRKIHDLVERMMKQNSALSYIDALTLVRQKHPELFEEYLNVSRVLTTYPTILDTPQGFVQGPNISIKFNREGGTPMTPQEAGKLIDQKVRQYIFDHPEVKYDKAMETVLSMNPELKKAYTTSGVIFPEGAVKYSIEEKLSIREEVHKKVMAYVEDTGEEDYEAAMSAVFDEDPALKERYAKS